MSKSDSTRMPFFSLLENLSTHFNPYQPSYVQAWNMWLARKTHNNRIANTVARFTVALGSFLPAMVAFTLIGVWGWVASMGALGVGLYALMKGWDHLHHFLACEKKAAFEEKVKDMRPPTEPHVTFKTLTQTFNQLYSFVVDKDHTIWYALRESRFKAPDWRPLFIEDYPLAEATQVDIQADGQNFMAKVTTNEGAQLFYKKVMQDSRDDSQYTVEDCIESPDSVNHWFSLPVISLLKPSTWGQRLKLNPMTRWLMSNDGALRHNKQDKKGEWHTIWNCTTVYMQEGSTLILYDPYVTPGTEVKISLPQGVKVLNIQVTSSRIFVFGEREVNGLTQDVIFERSIDYDVLGLNPIMPYTDYIHKVNERFLPLDKWKEWVLPNESFTGNMTVIQTGCDKNVEIRLETQDEQGLGFCYKTLEEDRWLKTKSDHAQGVSFYPEIPMIPQQSFGAKDVECFGQRYERVDCDFFDANIFDTRLKFFNQDQECLKLTLRRTANLVKAFLDGHTTQEWVLALTAAYQAKSEPCVFKDKHVMKVQVKQEKDSLIIQGDDFTLNLKATLPISKSLNFRESFEAEDLSDIEEHLDLNKTFSKVNTL